MSFEDQLWLWLEDCETRKPGQGEELDGLDKVVRVLQEGDVRGREAREAGAARGSKIAICNGSFILPEEGK